MSSDPQTLAERRRLALERLRAQRGEPRRQEDDRQKSNELLGKYFEPFVRSPEVDSATGKNARASAEDVQNFLSTAKSLRKGKEAPAAEEGTGAALASGITGLLQQAGAEHFAERFFRWLGGVPIDHGLSSTPVGELEKLLGEVKFRQKALEAMVRITAAESEALDAEIRARKVLANGIS